jgi:mono/diheme cytochrome c family protein
MNQINKLLLCLIFFGVACGKTRQNKHDEEDILKKGSELFVKYGCAVCHSLDGKEIYGPPLNGIYMKELLVIRKGQEFTVTADREYLKKAIVDPRFEKVLEYKNKEMPLTQISDEEAELLVDYIIALDNKTQLEK